MDDKKLTELIWEVVVNADEEAKRFIISAITIATDLCHLRGQYEDSDNYYEVRDELDQAVDSLMDKVSEYEIEPSAWLKSAV